MRHSKKTLSILLALVLILSLLPTAAFAAVEEPEAATPSVSIDDEDSGMVITKTVAVNNDGSYNLTMEAYATGTVVTTTQQCDIVMVLDMSTSMTEEFAAGEEIYNPIYESDLNQNSKYYVWKNERYRAVSYCEICKAYTNGCRNFWPFHTEGKAYTPKTGSEDPDSSHVQFYTREFARPMTRLEAMKKAATQFVDNVAAQGGNHRIAIVGFGDKASPLIGLTSAVNEQNKLKSTINSITKEKLVNATEHGKGMLAAKELLTKETNNKQVVVLFTDGAPEPKGSGKWSARIVKQAVNEAYETKNNYNAEVYVVSVFSSNSTDVNDNMDKYMSSVSSNYPYANYTGTGIEEGSSAIVGAIELDKEAASSYYLKAANVSALEEVFQRITTAVTTTNSRADAESVLTDELSKYFKSPEGLQSTDCTIQVSDCTGEDENGKICWGAPVPATNDVTVTIEGDTISVTGFSYKDNVVVEKDGKWQGKKLAITFNIILNEDADWQKGTHVYPTNKSATLSKGTEPLTVLEKSPTVPVEAHEVSYSIVGDKPEDITVPKSDVYLNGKTVAVANSPATQESGWEFDGWYYEENCEEPVEDESIVIDGADITLFGRYYKLEGGLVLSKTFTGVSLTDEQKSNIIFTITGPEGFEKREIPYGQFINGQYEISNVPAGDYTIVETNADFKGYIRETTYTVADQSLEQPQVMASRAVATDDTVNIPITDGNTCYVCITNDYQNSESSYEIPFTKIVKQGGNRAPGSQTFELEIFGINNDSVVDKYDDVTVAAAVNTNGVGEYDSKLVITGPANRVDEGFFVREKNTSAANWTYSDAVYYVCPASTPMELSDSEQQNPEQQNPEMQIFAAKLVNSPNGDYYDIDYTNTLDAMTFTNTYTRNYSSGGDTWTLTLKKVDADDSSYALPGAKFDLYRVGRTSDTKIGSYTTDSNGVARATVSVSGDYYWVETAPPTGYTLDGETKHYTSTDRTKSSITVTNEKTETPPTLNGDDHYAYVVGYPDGLVHPEAQITRAEVATIFFRLLNENVRNAHMTKDNSFPDVNRGDWFNTAVSTMAELGIIKGYPDGTFGSNDPITRAEFAAIAARFDSSSVSTKANFKDIEGHWAELEISKAAANGWVNGYADNTFKPDQNITRAEAMALINRVLNRNPETPADLLSDMIKWPDNVDTAKWYYLDVQEATNSHDYERKANNTERWTKLNEAPDWVALEK